MRATDPAPFVLVTACILGPGAVGCRCGPSLKSDDTPPPIERSAPTSLSPDAGGAASSSPDGAPSMAHRAVEVIDGPSEDSPLHVFMTTAIKEMPSGEHLCAIGDRPLYCGFRAVLSLSGSTLERDRSLEAGLPHESDGWLTDFVSDGFGHFPGDAWLLTDRGNPLSSSASFVYRWAGGRWLVAKPAFSAGSLLACTSLGQGGAVLARGERRPVLEGLGALRGRVWQLLEPGSPSGKLSYQGRCAHALVGFDDGSLIGVLDDSALGSDDVIERWRSPAARPVIERVPHEDADGERIVRLQGLWGARSDDLVVYGEVHHPRLEIYDPGALLARFQNGVWTRLTAPPEAERITGYASDAQGGEWVRGDVRGEPGPNPHLWKRDPLHGWSKVPLPVRCRPWTLDSIGGDIWVACEAPPEDPWYDGQHPSFILSTRAPSRVVDVDEVMGEPGDGGASSQSP